MSNSSSSKPDKLTAITTLLFLGKQVKTHQFILKAQVKRRKQAVKDEEETRLILKALKARFNRELDEADLRPKSSEQQSGDE